MAMQRIDEILTDFDGQSETLAAFTEQVSRLLRLCLSDGKIQAHSIEARVKDRQSLQKKLERKGADGKYESLGDITDLSGHRIITYFSDDVDRAGDLLKEEFVIDEANSVDKRSLHDPDRFGYLSLHYVVALKPQRLALVEYKAFAGMKAEIQIRSLLQHAWAEIEHDLGYKFSQGAIPPVIRRRFSRMAGLLEIADSEFLGIRDEVKAYEKDVAENIPNRSETVQIDKNSLTVFVEKSDLVRAIDSDLGETLEADIEADPGFMQRIAICLQAVGLGTLADVKAALEENQDIIPALARKWGTRSAKKISAGASLWYLGYVLVAQRQDLEGTVDFFRTIHIGREANREGLAKRLLTVYAKLGDGEPVA